MMNSITPTWFENVYAAADTQGLSIPYPFPNTLVTPQKCLSLIGVNT
jgi:hypothetical protein